MPVTVGEALQMHAFHRCRLLTGQAGLDNPIKWVNILEILDDLRHIEPGEFLITTGYGFNFAALAQQQRLLEQFAANRLAALAVQIGHYINEIPASFVQAAAAAGIPVLEVPAEISFKQLTRPLLNELMRQELADQSDTKGEEGDHFKVLASQSRALMQKILEGQNPEKYSDNLKTLRIFTHAKFYMLLIAPQPAAAAGGPVISGQQEPAGDRLLQNLMHMFVQYKLPFLATRHNHKLAALIQPSNPEPEQVIATMQQLLRELEQLQPHYDFFMGLSSCREHLSEAGSGLDEAAKALEAVRLRLIQGCNLACYQQLGFYKILLDTRNQELLHTIYREILAPLLAYDQRSGGALIATLRCYLKYLNLSLAAKELFIHRHTLRYRLEQIESLTGLQPNKPAHAFQLQMALMIHDFLMARHQDHS